MEEEMKTDTEEKSKDEIFVGREEELDELYKTLDSVAAQGCQTVFIIGEPGLGKTKFVHRFKEKAEKEGYIFLKGSCRYETSRPYRPLQRAFADSGKEDLKSLALMNRESDQEIEDKNMFEAQRSAAFYETTEQLKEVALEQPLVICLDDIHWADQGTLQLFHYMADRLDESPILFLATYRPGDALPGTPFIDTLQKMGRKHLYDEIELEPLEMEQTEEMIKELTRMEEVPEDFIQTIHEKTKGNPLFIKETVQQMMVEGTIKPESGQYPDSSRDVEIPDLIQDVIERRVFRLDDESREILQVGSVIGLEVPFPLLKQSSDMEDLDLLNNIDSLIETRLWEEGKEGDTFYFCHELILDTIHKGIGKWVEKRRIHRKVAEAMKDVYEDDIEDRYPSLAYHHREAEEFSKALDYYMKSGMKAEKVYAHEDAVEMYKKAIKVSQRLQEDEIDRLEILERMAKAYVLMGEYEEGREKLYSGLDYTSTLMDEQRIYRKVANSWLEQGQYEKALELVDKGLQIETEDDKTERCRLLGKKGWALMQRGEFEEAEDAFEEERNVAEEIENRKEIAQAYHDLGTLAIQEGDYDKGRERLEEARVIRQELEDLKGLYQTLNNLSVVHTYRSQLDEALEKYEKALEINEKMDNKAAMGGVLSNIGVIYYKKGEFEQALDYLQRGLESARKVGNKYVMSTSFIDLGQVYLAEDELEKASRYVDNSLEISDEIDNKEHEIIGRYIAAEVELKKGEIEDSEREAKKALKIATEIGAKREEGMSRQVLGMVQREKGSWDEAIDNFESSIDIFESLGTSGRQARSLYEYGILWKLKGEDSKAADHIQRALEIFEEGQMKYWVERCEEALKEIG